MKCLRVNYIKTSKVYYKTASQKKKKKSTTKLDTFYLIFIVPQIIKIINTPPLPFF